MSDKKKIKSGGYIDWDDIPIEERVAARGAGTPIVVPNDVEAWERQYKLPPLEGTPRQVDWARVIRRDLLRPIFQILMDFTTGLGTEQAADIYFVLDKLRGLRESQVWIEVLRPHAGAGAIPYLVRKSSQQESQRQMRQQEEAEKAGRLRKAAEGRAFAKFANEYAEQHDLPWLVSPVCSRPQESLGRRCRHEVLTALSKQELAAFLPLARTVDDPCIWIGAKGKSNPVQYVQQQATRREQEQHDLPGRPAA